MDLNERFIINTLGKITVELQLDFNTQTKIRNILEESLYNKTITENSTELVANDMNDKIAYYLQVRKLDGLSEKTLKNYYYTLNSLSNFIIKPINSITTTDLRMFIASHKDYKNSSLNTITNILKGFFKFLVDEEIIQRDPSRKLSLIKVPKRLRKSMTVEELERIRLACKTERERALIEFLFATGCRISEVANCNIKDINFMENTIRVVGKGNKERIVCFNDKSKLYIKKYLDTRTDNNPALFISSRKPYNRMSTRGLELIVSKVANRTSIDKKVFPHLFRHTMATLSLQSGANITTIQHLLGHTTPATTQIYAENSLENIKYEYKQHFIQ